MALVAALGLAGCATGGSQPAEQLGNVVAQVQAIGVKLCAFEPTAATVAAILATGNPGVMMAHNIAAAICAAVQAKASVTVASVEVDHGYGLAKLFDMSAQAQPAPQAPRVNGVPVHGRFVK